MSEFKRTSALHVEVRWHHRNLTELGSSKAGLIPMEIGATATSLTHSEVHTTSVVRTPVLLDVLVHEVIARFRRRYQWRVGTRAVEGQTVVSSTSAVLSSPVVDDRNVLTNEELLKLLDTTVSEEHHYLTSYHSELNFFWGLITAVAGATGVGYFNAKNGGDFLFLLLGPLAILVLSHSMRQGVARTYKRFIETITIRAKIEQALGLHRSTSPEGAAYWPGEALLASRHLDSRAATVSSAEFVRTVSAGGLYRVHRNMSLGLQMLAVGLAVLLVIDAVRA